MAKFNQLPPHEFVAFHLKLDETSLSGLRWRWDIGTAKRGDVAGSRSAAFGRYWCVKLAGKRYMASRLVWLLATGEDPGSRMVDHINHDTSDNRPCNLRLADHAENGRNRSSAQGSGSRFLGVSRCSKSRRWVATITVDGKRQTVGRFRTERAAALAYDAAARKAFGAFANPNIPALSAL